MENILKIKIDNTDIFIEELGENKGKITISDTYGHNYSNYWGAMGGNINEFLKRIDSYYFANKLLGIKQMQVFCEKATFRDLRKFIKEELDLPWYKHLDFQKDFREKLNSFQNGCAETESENFFVANFNYYFTLAPDFYLIEDRWERETIEQNFKSISEPWNFISTKESEESKWLRNLHKKLKKLI